MIQGGDFVNVSTVLSYQGLTNLFCVFVCLVGWLLLGLLFYYRNSVLRLENNSQA